MATYFVASGGSNTAPYDTWAKAATSLQTALTAASTADDIVVIQYNAVPSGDAELAADTIYTFAASILLISASNDGGSAWTPTPMGTGNWIGNSTTNRYVRFAGAFRCRTSGLTLRVSGGTNDNIELGQGVDGAHYEFVDTRFWIGNSNGGCSIILGSSTSNHNGYVKLVRPIVTFGNPTQEIIVNCDAEIEGLVVDTGGSAPTELVNLGANASQVRFTGCDLSHVTGTLVASGTSNGASAIFDRCELGSGVAWLATQAVASKASAKATIIDCSSGDTHGIFGYQDALGLLTLDTGIYVTASPAAASWKIVTTANASRYTPFVTPWVSTYWSATAGITPRLEVLRDGSATAYTDAEVWGEFLAKVTIGSTLGTFHTDRAALSAAGTAQATGAGLSAWTGENATAWSGKVDSGAPLTPAEAGDMSARLLVGVASSTVYVNPQIETA